MWTKTRAQVAAMSKKVPRGHPDLVALQSKLRGEKLYLDVKTELARDPRPSDAQLVEIAHLLLAARSDTSTTVDVENADHLADDVAELTDAAV